MSIDFVRSVLNSYPRQALPSDYPVENTWVLTPDILRVYLACIELLKPKLVLEFGSGYSTRLAAPVLAQFDGRIRSFDHEKQFATETSTAVAGFENAEVRYRPLRLIGYGPRLLANYDFQPNDISTCHLALVDGPTGWLGREAVMYSLFPALSVGGWVIVDDAARKEESMAIRKWRSAFGRSIDAFCFDGIGRGLAMFHKLAEAHVTYQATVCETALSWRHALYVKRHGFA